MTTIVVLVSVFVLALCYGAILASLRARWNDVPRAGNYVSRLSPTQLLSLRPNETILTERDVIIIDVSKWEGAMDFLKAWAAGAFGVIIKCGQGLAFDPMFVIFWNLAKFAGLKRSTYWFYDSRVDPEVQARLWASAIKADPGEMPHFADYEETYNGKWKGVANFQNFLIEFQSVSQLPTNRIGIYTGYYYWIDNGANDSFFSRYWLWLAWYAASEVVKIPKPWIQDRVLFWQFTSNGDGNKYGASSKEIDLSYFVKGKQMFGQMFGNVTEVPAGDSMTQWYKVNSPTGLNVRSGPGTTFPKLTALPYGDLIEGLTKMNGWVQFKQIYRAGQLIPAPDVNNSWCTDSYLVPVDSPIVPPEPTPAAVKHTIEVFDDGSLRIDNGNTIP